MASVIVSKTVVILAGILGIGISAAIIAYLYLPHATIIVHPKTSTKTTTQPIQLSADNTPDFVRFTLPATFIEHSLTNVKTISRSTGTTHSDYARGTVTLHNDRADEQSLLPKTHLRHEQSGVFFLTDEAVTIPAKGTISVGVTAKETGSSGNVPSGKFVVDKLSPALQQYVYGDSSQAFTGGVATDQPITEEELTKAKTEALDNARHQIEGEVTAKADGKTIRNDLIVIQTDSQTSSADIGSTAPDFSITTILSAKALVVDENDLLSLTLLGLRTQPPDDQEFVSYDPQSFSVKVLRLDFDRKYAQLEGSLTGTFAMKVSPGIFQVSNLAGRTKAEVEEYFKEFPSVGAVDVTFSPFWVTTVPSRENAVEITIKNEEKE